jgi:polysaccharide pyruvyl transferase WcaK-like protein
MLITITGAYKNAGDHLIGLRAKALLEKFVDGEVVNIDRKQPIDYEFLNTAKAVVLTGGPALQPGIHPGVYDLDLEKINVPVIGFGLGWKASLGKKPAEFEFSQSSLVFLEKLKASMFSVRDQQSFELLESLGFQKLSMTGCPAWYDLEKIDDEFTLPSSINHVVLSTPAVPNKQLLKIAKLISKKYPKAKKTLMFQAGFESTHSKKSSEYTKQLKRVSLRLKLSGWESVSTESDPKKMMEVLSSADLHIGYRVHSHLFMLSQRKVSVLIAEDARGESQNTTLGLQNLTRDSSIEDINEYVSLIVDDPKSLQPTIKLMQESFEDMKQFLKKLKAL